MRRTYRCAILMLLLIFSTMAVGGCGNKVQPTEKESSIKVETAVVKKMNINKYASYSGIIKGSNEEAVMAKVARRISAVYVEEGQSVRNGQILFSLDRGSSDIGVEQAQAALATAKAAEAANQIQLQAALRNLNRTQELYKAGAVSIQAMETAQDQVDALRSGAVEAAVAQAQAGVKSALKNIEDCEITSPIDGVIGRIDVSVGDTASMQSPVAVINTTDTLEVEVNVSESDVDSVETGTAVKVWIEAIGKSLPGTITSIATIADSNSGCYPVTVNLQNNPEAQVKSGMFAEIKLATIHRENILSIPMSAVLPQNGESVVYVVTNKSRSHSVKVQTGINDGKYIEITKGLQSGQKVVTKGNTLIEENTLLDLSDGGTAK